ncbi:D-serine dehydratase [Inquilinus ginsengisoli]|uniref:D-serine dehydratase n=1 Tax=Inquilinus ginsengisoli TaxID=363840 RepID=A0ABU1JUY8_9PROT|nr:amino acid deaminase [Inquilinus ginsengisoli]MDR6291375.1 D-serine dehydratase [Inquilinus ginsengisoli]
MQASVLDLDPILDSAIDGATKGLPPGLQPIPFRAVGDQGWNALAGDLPFPQAVLKRSVIERNARWMRDILAETGVALAPHGKTTMSPQLFDLQLANGSWGITVATAQQFEVCRRFGVKRILVANQLVDAAAMRSVLAALAADPALEAFCLVDSVAGVERLAEAARVTPPGRKLGLLVELGMVGRRTGCRTAAEALEVARATAGRPGLALRGVEGYEGLVVTQDAAADEIAVAAFLDDLAAVAAEVDRAGLFGDGTVLLSAGGSAYYDIVARKLSEVRLSRQVQVVIRSGCYLTHDSGQYTRLFEHVVRRIPADWRRHGDLEPALEVWSAVQSRPEPGLAILTMGKRDCSYDIDLPIPTLWRPAGSTAAPQRVPAGAVITGLNDQHAYLKLPEGFDPQVGDLIGCGISHPCTTFDKWQVMMVVEDDYRVSGAIRTFF